MSNSDRPMPDVEYEPRNLLLGDEKNNPPRPVWAALVFFIIVGVLALVFAGCASAIRSTEKIALTPLRETNAQRLEVEADLRSQAIAVIGAIGVAHEQRPVNICPWYYGGCTPYPYYGTMPVVTGGGVYYSPGGVSYGGGGGVNYVFGTP